MEHNNQYNEEPVFYCNRCLSLAIIRSKGSYCYCKECNSADLGVTDIDDWEELYKKKYGIKFRYRKLIKK